MDCGALSSPSARELSQMNSQWSNTIFSSLGGNEPVGPPRRLRVRLEAFLPSALSNRAYPYQARLEDCVSDLDPVDKVLFVHAGWCEPSPTHGELTWTGVVRETGLLASPERFAVGPHARQLM